ncbi:MAG: glucose 1-dehydrogenase [Chloroflexota bacterium]|nr:glucose 1-dehydrogenase [Chloroflexota bacterium]
MRAIAVTPGVASSARLVEVAEPNLGPGQVLVRTLQVGICGTDAEINRGFIAESAPGGDYLILGHESLGRVEALGEGPQGLALGDYVVATVRRPCPQDCLNCHNGESDMCLTGNFTERGIVGIHGFLTECYVEEPRYLVKVPPALKDVAVLLEPLSVVEKAVSQTFAIQGRLRWQPRTAVVVGVGAIGLLAVALLRLRGLETHALARSARGTPASQVAEAMGATYWSTREHPLDGLARELGNIDIVVEASGNAEAALQAMGIIGNNGILSLVGVYSPIYRGEQQVPVGRLVLDMVLGNRVVFGSVNASRRYFEVGLEHMAEMESRWPGVLGRFLTRRLSLDDFPGALEKAGGDIKTVIDVGEE